MKAKVMVRLKPGVLDVQGKAVERGLKENGYPGIGNVRIGKLIEFDCKTEDQSAAKVQVEEMCKKLLTNTIIENFEITFQSK